MTTSTSDLTNALALIDTAVRAIRQAEPVMARYLGEAPENIAVWAVAGPIFQAASDLLDVHEFHIATARAALEKVTER